MALFMFNWSGYFLGNFWRNLGYFLLQHLVTLQGSQASLDDEHWAEMFLIVFFVKIVFIELGGSMLPKQLSSWQTSFIFVFFEIFVVVLICMICCKFVNDRTFFNHDFVLTTLRLFFTRKRLFWLDFGSFWWRRQVQFWRQSWRGGDFAFTNLCWRFGIVCKVQVPLVEPQRLRDWSLLAKGTRTGDCGRTEREDPENARILGWL